MEKQKATESPVSTSETSNRASLIVAGGCFWCIEAHMKLANGVAGATSGYSGGESENPTYENYASGGHREVVEVIYDPEVTSYEKLVQYYTKDIDPTDGGGSFGDRGEGYAPAIYYETEDEKEIAGDVLKTLEESKLFTEPIQVDILPKKPFWPAEEYHQDYARKKPMQYGMYHKMSGREGFIQKHWGDDPQVFEQTAEGSTFRIDNELTEDEIREKLTDWEYKVNREGATDTPFQNEYHDNYEPGIYVDKLSGAPLFSSIDKFHSGTGWPSFTTPLEPDNIATKSDRKLLMKRTEVLTKDSGNHLGHLFKDGPTDPDNPDGAKPTGLRYCLNTASLKFIPKDKMEEEGYEKYLYLFA